MCNSEKLYTNVLTTIYNSDTISVYFKQGVFNIEGRRITLEITDVKVKLVNAESKMKAVASVTFDDAFVVHDIKIIEGQEKLFTAMPSRKTPENEFKDIAHPINSSMRRTLEDAVIAKYQECVSESEAQAE